MPGRSYLIDFENVNSCGLAGIETLNEDDCVYIFFTDNANKLLLDYIADSCVPLVVKKVAGGRQSLDMHLVSFLGYLIGCEPDEGRQYFVISKDQGFDGVCGFWNRQFMDDLKIIRQPSIGWDPYECDLLPEPEIVEDTVDPDLLSKLGALIRSTIHRIGQMTRDNCCAVLLSQLCASLGENMIYQECRHQTGLKAQQMLEKYFASIVTVKMNGSCIWVYDTPNAQLLHKQKQAALLPDEPAAESAPEVDPPMENTPVDDSAVNTEACPLPISTVESDPVSDPCEEISVVEIIEAPPRDETAPVEPAVAPLSPEENDPSETRNAAVGIISDCMLVHGIDQEDIAELADWIALMIGEKNGKMAIYHAVLTRYGLKRGLEIYAKIRESLESINLPGGNCFLKKRSA